MPPPTALVRSDTNHNGAPIWVLSALTALGEEWTHLLAGLIAAARAANIVEINGLQPDSNELNHALEAAGFTGESEEDRLCLFELSPIPHNG
jgi:hypothetical protein